MKEICQQGCLERDIIYLDVTEEEHGMGDVALQYVQLCSSPLCLHCGLFAQRPFLTMLHFPTVQFYFNLFYP